MTDAANAAKAAGPAWLSPTAALTRYAPAIQAKTGRVTREIQHVRYGFRVGNIGLVMDQNKASEIIEELPVRAIPNTVAWFKGLINLRGNLVPVFDLKTLLGIGHAQLERRWMLVVDKGDKAIAIPLDELPEVVDVGQRSAQPPPTPEPLRAHVHAAYVKRGQVWLEFDLESFLMGLSTQIAN